MTKWRCEDCGWLGTHDQLLIGYNPFDATQIIHGCPVCKEINTMAGICDEPGCEQKVCCGWNTDDGRYRNTCFNHSKFKQQMKDKGIS